MANDTQRMWLHDESKTVNVLPYTTLDSIKMRVNNDLNINNYTSFEDDYNNLKSLVNLNKDSADNSFNSLSNRIDNIVITQSVATHYQNGLMSKEDKVKLDSIENGGGEYTPSPATTDSLGCIIVGDNLSVDGNGRLSADLQSRNLNSLSDVLASSPTNNQVLSFDSSANKWINKTLSSVNSIDNIGDIDLNNPINNQVLKYVDTGNGGYWTNGNLEFTSATLDSFSDVEITNPANGEIIKYNSVTQKWENASQYQLPPASRDFLGGIIVGDRLSISNEGVLSADVQHTSYPTASTSVEGVVKIDGTTITIDNNGVISATQSGQYQLEPATTTDLGGVIVDGTTITVDNNGVISAVNSSSTPVVSSNNNYGSALIPNNMDNIIDYSSMDFTLGGSGYPDVSEHFDSETGIYDGIRIDGDYNQDTSYYYNINTTNAYGANTSHLPIQNDGSHLFALECEDSHVIMHIVEQVYDNSISDYVDTIIASVDNKTSTIVKLYPSLYDYYLRLEITGKEPNEDYYHDFDEVIAKPKLFEYMDVDTSMIEIGNGLSLADNVLSSNINLNPLKSVYNGNYYDEDLEETFDRYKLSFERNRRILFSHQWNGSVVFDNGEYVVRQRIRPVELGMTQDSHIYIECSVGNAIQEGDYFLHLLIKKHNSSGYISGDQEDKYFNVFGREASGSGVDVDRSATVLDHTYGSTEDEYYDISLYIYSYDYSTALPNQAVIENAEVIMYILDTPNTSYIGDSIIKKGCFEGVGDFSSLNVDHWIQNKSSGVLNEDNYFKYDNKYSKYNGTIFSPGYYSIKYAADLSSYHNDYKSEHDYAGIHITRERTTLSGNTKTQSYGSFNSSGLLCRYSNLINDSYTTKYEVNLGTTSIEFNEYPDNSSSTNIKNSQYYADSLYISNKSSDLAYNYKLRMHSDPISGSSFIYHDTINISSETTTTKSVEWSTSDRRMKHDIKPLSTTLSHNLINATETKEFKYNDSEDRHYGMIAQEIREVLDNLGETDSALEYSIGDTGVKDQRNIHYSEYIPHLINYVKDLQSQVDELKEKIDELKGE